VPSLFGTPGDDRIGQQFQDKRPERSADDRRPDNGPGDGGATAPLARRAYPLFLRMRLRSISAQDVFIAARNAKEAGDK